MFLNKLTIKRERTWDREDPGRLEGAVEFIGDHGKVEIALDEQLSAEIVKLCAAGISRAANQLSGLLKADVIEATALPAPDSAAE